MYIFDKLTYWVIPTIYKILIDVMDISVPCLTDSHSSEIKPMITTTRDAAK